MTTTLILSKFLGLYFFGIGFAFIINPKRAGKVYQLMMANEAILFLGGVVALLLGAFMISIHNIWVIGWPLVITLFAWWSFIKGVALLGTSQFTKCFSFMFHRSHIFYRISGIISALIGVFFIYMGLTW